MLISVWEKIMNFWVFLKRSWQGLFFFFFFFFFLKSKDCVWWSEQCVTVVCHSDPGEASFAEIFFRFEGD